MIAGHGVDQCTHGTLVRQCRCVTHNEVRIVPCPASCRHRTEPDQAPREAEPETRP